MEIDWITVSAQIVNFLILVYLLRRFLYQPIMNAMARREERIAAERDEARAEREAAERERAHYSERTRSLDTEREAVLERAREAAERAEREMIGEARTRTTELARSWREEIVQEKEEFLADLRRRACAEFVALARRAMRDLADEDFAERLARAFLQRLGTLGDAAREKIAEAAGGMGNRLRLVAAVELDQALRERLTAAIEEVLGKAPDIAFETSDDALGGIALEAGGYRVGWSLEDYLNDYEAALAERISVAEERKLLGDSPATGIPDAR